MELEFYFHCSSKFSETKLRKDNLQGQSLTRNISWVFYFNPHLLPTAFYPFCFLLLALLFLHL